jgi:hypothetical protein
MNRRGEVEIALNKRWIERGIFTLIIVVLAVLVLKGQNTQTSDDTSVLQLTEQLDEKTAQILHLEKQLAEKESAPAPTPASTAPVPVAPAPVVSNLSGKAVIDWEVDGAVLTPADYNSVELAELQAEIDALEEDYETASSQKRSEINDKIDDLEREIRALETGESKYKLRNVTLTVENGRQTAVELEYILCWPQIDCLHVRSRDMFTVKSGETVTKVLPLTIPTTVLIDKTKQQLRLTIKEDGEEIFEDDYVITV